MTIPFAKRANPFMPYGLPRSGGSSGGGGNAIEGAVISQVPALQLAKTNFIIGSGDFSNAAWTNTAVVTPNTTAAPNGATQGDTLNDNSAVATLTSLQNCTIPNDTNPYTASCYFTVGTSAQAQLAIDLTGGATPVNTSVDFNPTNGAQIATTGVGTVAISAVSINGVTWIRVAVTASNNGTGNTNARLTISPASANVASQGTVIAWGAQVEQNSVASDLIQTDIVPLARRAGLIPPYLQDRSFGVRNVATNYAIDPVMDNGRMIMATTSVTLTMPSLASAGPGFTFWLKNAGTGALTVNATTATELLRVPGGPLAGSTSQTFPYSATTGAGPWNVSGGAIMVGTDNVGSAAVWDMVSTLEAHGEIMFTTNGTFVVPAGVVTAWVDGVGGGGGGGSGTTQAAGGGASGGACAVGAIVSLVPGAAHTINVGTGGAGGTTGASGSNGGSSAFGALISLPGGNRGSGANAVTTAGGPSASAGLGSGVGMGGILPGGAAFGGAGGGTIYGPTTPMTVNAGLTTQAISFGAGGAGSINNAQPGGSGAPGFIRIRW